VSTTSAPSSRSGWRRGVCALPSALTSQRNHVQLAGPSSSTCCGACGSPSHAWTGAPFNPIVLRWSRCQAAHRNNFPLELLLARFPQKTWGVSSLYGCLPVFSSVVSQHLFNNKALPRGLVCPHLKASRASDWGPGTYHCLHRIPHCVNVPSPIQPGLRIQVKT
jgi:hypothetical protein